MLQGKPLTKELLEYAALKTFTGKWAKSKGYGKPELHNADSKIFQINTLGDIELLDDIVFIFKK
ncbi:MAG: molybdopterin-converting factor subunit 2 [Chryseobacterium gambrini]|nr:molybdopterin-converting factor subunit 2 [Chryseobacterium gambrini]